MSPRGRSEPRPPRDQRPDRPGDGQRPLLQGHLRRAGQRGRVTPAGAPPEPDTTTPGTPVSESGAGSDGADSANDQRTDGDTPGAPSADGDAPTGKNT